MSIKKKIKVLVTGGAGYIGSHAIVELLATGYDVVSVDNFSNSTAKTFDRIKKITGVKVKNYDVDLCDTDALHKVFAKEKNITAIMHFAALKSVPESVKKPRKYYKNNVGGMVTLLEVAEAFLVHDIIFSSTCAVYGEIKKLPVSETTKLRPPASPYAASKLLCEQLLGNFSCTHLSARIAILRYFNPVGAHQSGLLGELPIGTPDNLVPYITQTAIGKRKELIIFGNNYKTRDGTCVRDYVHVSDIARAHVDALRYLLKQKKATCEVFNLGSGKGVTVLELVQAFLNETMLHLEYRFGPRRAGDIAAVYADPAKAKRVLGWKIKHTIKDAMKSAWRWEQHLAKKKGK